MSFRPLVFVLVIVFLAVPLVGQVNWEGFSGPTGETWSRLGTDGTNLYFTTNGFELWRYSFPPGDPGSRTWTQLPTAPRRISDWDSYRGLAHQSGYLYTSASANTGARTVLRHDIALDAWEIWGNPTGTGSDLNICNTSGNAMFMDPTQPGVGYSAWHGGNSWVSYDWNAQTADNGWMSTAGLPVNDPHWVSRNEGITDDGAGNYYSMKNDWTGGLSSGDAVYTFTLGGAPSLVAQKPFEAGAGQTLTYVPSGHYLNLSLNDELWLLRGNDCAVAPHEGWGSAGTQDYAIYDLVGQTWTPFTTPFWMGTGSDSVMIGNWLFVKSAGDSGNADSLNDEFYVARKDAFSDPYGTGCPGAGGFVAASSTSARPVLGTTISVIANQIEGGSQLSLIFGFSDTTWLGTPLPFDLGTIGFSGCLLHASVNLQIPAGAGPGGPGAATASVPFVLPGPGYPGMAGADFFTQWIVLDSAGLSFSDGLRLHLQTF